MASPLFALHVLRRLCFGGGAAVLSGKSAVQHQ
jgi:hypothetical protein